jgi:tyrosyl-tRNA synthetase
VTYKSEFLKTLDERGFIHQGTDLAGLDALCAKEKVTAYIGFDATADSLHVGSLIQIMKLRWLQKTGHQPIVLMGGGTTRVGDPSFRDEARKLMDDAAIAKNIDGIKKCFASYLNFGAGKNDALLVNNADWLDKLNYIDVLREYGPHFTINRMLSFDSVKLRLERESPLTFLEFNYMIMQSIDFVELFRRTNCRLQMGGSDQWGNIVNGADLGRRILQKELFGLTSPLITTASGAKMGKTAEGAIWLNADKLSPYHYYQFWRNCEDADVKRFLGLFTELPMAEVNKLGALQGADINEAKKILAFEATKLCHGEKAAQDAAETAKQAFEQGASAEGLPTVEIPKNELSAGITIADLLCRAGLVESKGEAKRLIKGGGAKVNDQPVADENGKIDLSALNDDGVIKLTAGKKRHALIKAN